MEQFLLDNKFTYNSKTDEYERLSIDGKLLIYKMPTVRSWVLAFEDEEEYIYKLFECMNIDDIGYKLKEIDRDIKLKCLLGEKINL